MQVRQARPPSLPGPRESREWSTLARATPSSSNLHVCQAGVHGCYALASCQADQEKNAEPALQSSPVQPSPIPCTPAFAALPCITSLRRCGRPSKQSPSENAVMTVQTLRTDWTMTRTTTRNQKSSRLPYVTVERASSADSQAFHLMMRFKSLVRLFRTPPSRTHAQDSPLPTSSTSLLVSVLPSMPQPLRQETGRPAKGPMPLRCGPPISTSCPLSCTAVYLREITSEQQELGV